MSSTPAVDPTQQPPPFPPVIQEYAYKPDSSHGSVGPVIGVLAVVMVLGAVAVVIGRLCSGRRVMGHVQYDFEGWMETKCSTCIDGRISSPPWRQTVPVVVVESGGSSVLPDEAASGERPDIPADVAPPQAEGASNHQPPQEQEQHDTHESLKDGG